MEVKCIVNEVGTVSVPKSEYEALVRDSETLDIITAMVRDSKYVSISDLKIILRIEESEEKKNAETV